MARGAGPSTLHSVAWVSMFVISVLMVAAGLYIISEPVSGDDFESATGIVWEDVQATEPEAANYLVREARLLGVAFSVLGVAAVAVTWSLLRKGSRTGWRIAWFVPLAFGGSAGVFFAADASGLGAFYAAAAVIAVAIVAVGSSAAWE